MSIRLSIDVDKQDVFDELSDEDIAAEYRRRVQRAMKCTDPDESLDDLTENGRLPNDPRPSVDAKLAETVFQDMRGKDMPASLRELIHRVTGRIV